MIIKQVKEFLKRLSSDFDDNKIVLNVNGKHFNIHDFYLTGNELIVEGEEEKFKDTVFDDDTTSSLKCINWNTSIKLQMVKAYKEATGLGLRESKDIIDANVPFVVAVGKSNAEYETLKAIFPDDTEFEIE